MSVKKLLSNKHFKYGVPFIITVVGGSFGLQFYSQLRYDVHKERYMMTKTKELQKIIGASKIKPIEEEYEEMRKEVDIDNWKNIRGPRPWEGNEEYERMMEAREEKAKAGWEFKK